MQKEKTKKKNIKQQKTIIGITLTVVIVIALIALIRPTLVGYSVYKQLETQDATPETIKTQFEKLNGQVTQAQEDIESYKQENEKINKEAKALTDQLSVCLTKQTSLKQELLKNERDYEKDLAQLRKDYEDKTTQAEHEESQCVDNLNLKQQQVSDLQAELQQFLKNTARSVCCKERVDNPKISGYTLVNARLHCLESGGKSIDCS